MLFPHLCEVLRDWRRAPRLQVGLFPSQNPTNPIAAGQLNRAAPLFWGFAARSRSVKNTTTEFGQDLGRVLR
jgi:hypothetical protein